MTNTVKTVELHIIQSLPSSNVNRDDTGSPKTATFGGATRLRVSSQAWKRAMRLDPTFASLGPPPAERTRLLKTRLQALVEEIEQSATEEESSAVIAALLPKLFSKMRDDKKDAQQNDEEDRDEKPKGLTSTVLYVSQSEIEATAQAVAENWDDLRDEGTRSKTVGMIVKQLAKRFKGVTSSPEIACFGRMMTTRPELTMDAACQVAPALSTHAVDIEEDFFTTVDTLADEGSGAAMMGYTPFASGAVYRYLALHWPQLVSNLAGDTDLSISTVEAFIRAAVVSMPSGMKNRFANNVKPAFVMAVVRDGGFPLSLVNAFERPVRANWREPGLIQPSFEALKAHWRQLCQAYGDENIVVSPIIRGTHDLELSELAECEVASLDDLVQQVVDTLC